MPTNRPLFKLSALLLALALVAGMVVSCRPGPNDGQVRSTRRPNYDTDLYGELESVDPHGQVVVLWYSFQRDREELLLRLIDDFNTANKWGITVLGEYGGPSETLHADLLSRIESDALSENALPQAVIAERHQVAAYAMRDVALMLDPFVESEAWGYDEEALADFVPEALALGQLPQFDGTYAWPLDLATEVLYYNEDWLVELGYTAPPADWEEFGEMACAAPQLGRRSYGYEFSADAMTYSDMVLSRAGRVLDEDRIAYVFDQTGGLESLAFVQELVLGGCAVVMTERTGDRNDFGAGEVLFVFDSTSELEKYNSAVVDGAGFNWSVSPLPSSEYLPKTYVFGSVLSVFKSTPEKQLASWLFFRWLSAPEQQARWAETFSTFPTRLSSLEMMEQYLAERPWYQQAFGFLEFEPVVEPGVVGYGECRGALEEMLAGVAKLEEPGVWLTNTAEACEASLE
jgi:ABC-type glycerol-3-phosphate transport system substrate-binding protein